MTITEYIPLKGREKEVYSTGIIISTDIRDINRQ